MGALRLKRMSGRERRHLRIRKRILGSPERPRLCVHRTLRYLYAQLVDDTAGRTLFTLSSRDERIRSRIPSASTVQAAQALGSLLAEEAKGRGIVRVVFDRAGYRYHGRVKALADAVRQGGIQC